MANTTVSAATLDFDDIVAAQKARLKSQTQFRDYNFEGSAMSVLLGILAHNTHLNAFYLNMMSNERSLDTAQLRDSVVARAKELNYVPRSTRSSVATLDISIPVANVTTLTVPQGTVFTSQNENGNFVFVNRETSVYQSSTGTFTIEGLKVYEGAYLTETYVVDTADEDQRFRLTTVGADTESLSVTVTTPGANATSWIEAENLYGLGPTSNVFFVQAAASSTYEVTFGDDVLGRAPQNGSVVTLRYMVTSGKRADNCETFRMSSDLGPSNGGLVGSPLVIETIQDSTGGADIESIPSIKRNAPRHYQTQMRAATDDDYVDIVLEEFPDVVDAASFGGEITDTTVDFGKVFISAIGSSSTQLTESRQRDIKILLEDRNSMGMEVVVVDPEILYVIPTIITHVDTSELVYSTAALKAAISRAMVAYSDDSLGRFNVAYRQSVLSEIIKDVDRSIVGVEITQTIKKILSPTLQTAAPITLSFRNAVEIGVTSTDFLSEEKRYRFTDTVEGVTPDGTIYLFEVNPALTTPVYSSIGVVDYVTGEITIGEINIFGYVTEEFLAFSATPAGQTVYAKKQDVVSIDAAEASITVSAT
jgi:hypothetical protein